MVDSIEWQPEFTIVRPDKRKSLGHQTAYNARFEIEFQQLDWDIQPRLSDSPRLIGEYQDWDAFTFVEDGKLKGMVRRSDIYALMRRGLAEVGRPNR